MNLIVREAEYNERIEKLLTALDPVLGVEVIKRLMQEKKILAHEVVCNGYSVGFYLFSVDELANGDRELVIRHAISDVKGPKPLIHILSQIFPGVGLQLKCKRVRIHSETRKMDDLLEAGNYRFMESIFIKDI